MPKSILIIGGSGFVGSHLALRLRKKHKVFATYYKSPMAVPGITHLPVHVENKDWLKRLTYLANPDVVIYAAGSQNTKWIERNPQLAEYVHSSGVANVLASTEILQPKFIYLSSPYVFDGAKGDYHETDGALPSSLLGKLKVGGENAVRGRSLNYIVVRMSPLIGRSNGTHPSFLDFLRISLDRGMAIPLSDKELHSFCSLETFYQMIETLIDSGVRNRVFHLGGLTKLSFLEFGKAFAERFGYDPKQVYQTDEDQNLTPPLVLGSDKWDYSLNSTQLCETLKIKPLLLEECFNLIDKQLIP